MRAVFCTVFLLVLLPCLSAASPHRGLSILYVGKIDNDCMPDTVIGEKKGRATIFIQSIRWGIGKCTTDETPKKQRDTYYPITLFNYPNWDIKQCNAFFAHLNKDSLIDIGITLKATITVDSTTKDTSLMVILFGQNKLRAQPYIVVAEMDENKQQTKVKRWTKQHDLLDAKRRDNSGAISYKLPRYNTDFSREEEEKQFILQVQSSPTEESISMSVYPNPAAYFVNVSLKAVAIGNYRVDFYTTSGELMLSKEFYCTKTDDIIQQVDLDKVTGGMYIARLYHAGLLVHSYPFIIVK